MTCARRARPVLAALAAVLLAALAAAAPARAHPAFRVADAVEGGALWLWLDPAWPGWRGAAPGVEVSVDGGPAAAVRPQTGGLHRLEGLADGRAASVRLRAAGQGGPGAWSEPAAAVPTAPGFGRFAVWADGLHDAPLGLTTVGLGAGSAAPEGVNVPVRLPSGAEVEHVGGPDSLFVRHFAHDSPANQPGGRNPAPRPVPEIRRRIFEPAGGAIGLAPLETRTEPYRARAAGDREDRVVEAVVLGAAGAVGRPAMSVVGLDPDGDPVAFRFDRLHTVGQHRDGRPWVVGPVRLLRNGAPPLDVAAGEVVARGGALLSVVERPGLEPPPAATLTPDFAPDYRRAGPEPDWSAWEGARPEPAGPPGTGLTARPQFETLHLGLRGAGPGPVALRFRAAGGGPWHPAQPLLFDGRLPPPELAAVPPAPHRGVLLHLEPGRSYEIEALQDGRLWRAAAATLSHKRPKADGGAVGVVDGDLVIRQGGAPGRPVEYRDGTVRGGRVLVAASHVVLRDIDVLGAPAHAIEIAPGVRDVRIVRGRIAGWGRSDLGIRPTNLGWGEQYDAAIAGGEPPADRPDDPLRDSRDDVAVIGVAIGSPRRPANAWQEWNPRVLPEARQIPGTDEHPWGPYAVSIRNGSLRGGWTLTDLSVSAAPLRSLNDAIGGDRNHTAGVGGFGPDFVLAHSYIGGAADDLIEHEGSGQTGVILGNFFDSVPVRPYTRSPPFALGLSVPYWGPTYVLRNAIRRAVPPGWQGVRPDGRAFKIQRREPQLDAQGRVLLFHNTAFGEPLLDAVHGVGAPVRHVTGRNNLFLAAGEAVAETPADEPTNDWDASNRHARAAAAMPEFEGGSHVPRSAAGLEGAPLANVNDGGPWAARSGPPAIGAAEPAAGRP